MKGRTVRIYLVDGTSEGILKAEIMNWTGIITVAPRVRLADLTAIEEVQRTGLYILSGKDPENQEIVYIGESDDVRERLAEHNRNPDKAFWRRTAVITGKDANLTKAHCRYLESRLIQLAAQAQRVKLQNNNNLELTPLPEPDVADMENFLDEVLLLLPVLEFTFAVQLPTGQKTQAQNELQHTSPMFELTEVDVNALAQEIGDEFVVLKGSSARKRNTQGILPNIRENRDQLVRDGKLKDKDHEFWVFETDVPFSSPSAAANVVTGSNYNGRIKWKLQGTQKTYAEWIEEQVPITEKSIDKSD